MQDLPEGLVVSSGWLAARGYSRQLLHKYVAGSWLVREGRGAYRRPGPTLSWEQQVYSLQLAQAALGHVGGASALWMHGLTHYGAAAEPSEIWFYSVGQLPSWARQEKKVPKIVRFPLTLFSWRKSKGRETADYAVEQRAWGPRKWLLRMSTPERATLELLDEVPGRLSHEYVWDTFTGLTSLSPKRLQTLLEHCTSVKVKRVFLALAERQRHSWFVRLDLSRIDLGSGKRAFVRGGRLDPKYLITLPESWRAI